MNARPGSGVYPNARPGWSLTRRLALRFAATMCALVALYALWSSYYVFDRTRADLRAFMEHETEELAVYLRRSDGSEESAMAAVAAIAEVSEEPACAFRVRAADGRLVAEDGAPELLALVTEPFAADGHWRRHLFDKHIGLERLELPDEGLVIELVVDAEPALDAVLGYLVSALLAFLVAALLAGLGAWFTASRGLRSLRDVVGQARSIDPMTAHETIRLEGAPDEVRELGTALNGLLRRIDGGLVDMRTFTASLAHELRSPLQNLIGESEVALLSERSVGEYKGLLQSNLDDLHELSDAVDNLVAFCRRSEPPAVGARAEVFDLAEEARLRLGRECRTAEREGVGVQIEAEGDTRIRADREGVLRLLRNLVSNAIGWSPRGGRIRVAIIGRDDRVQLIVEDEGPGVAPELRPHIFEPFVSGGQPDRRGSYGLGLAICRSVVDEHGGTLAYLEREPHGARFEVTLPREAAPSSGPVVAVAGA